MNKKQHLSGERGSEGPNPRTLGLVEIGTMYKSKFSLR